MIGVSRRAGVAAALVSAAEVTGLRHAMLHLFRFGGRCGACTTRSFSRDIFEVELADEFVEFLTLPAGEGLLENVK